MELLIVRHAIAFERSATRWADDDERPLSPQGVERARQAAAGLKRVAKRPARVLTSPLLRARQTAAILTQFARWPKASICPQLQPGAAPEALFALLLAKQVRTALVGHQPDLGHFVAACLPGLAASAAFEFKKMGVALVRFRGVPRLGHGELLWLVPPRMLRAAREGPAP
jgi:phosphohistidine phosphatase